VLPGGQAAAGRGEGPQRIATVTGFRGRNSVLASRSVLSATRTPGCRGTARGADSVRSWLVLRVNSV
jgi:hypothetical protein